MIAYIREKWDKTARGGFVPTAEEGTTRPKGETLAVVAFGVLSLVLLGCIALQVYGVTVRLMIPTPWLGLLNVW
jgi:hypothetical protein